jgi:hypothetical protein
MHRHVRTVLAIALLAPVTVRAQIAVQSSTVEEKTSSPGDRYSGTIVITNMGAQPQVARIYQTDYRFAADGTSNFDDPGTTPRSNARWVVPQATRVVVPAGSSVTVPYTVTVPASDSLTGTYWSAIMVEGQPIDDGAALEGAGGKPAVAIGAVIRYAVQLATHIRTTGTRTVRFTETAATTAPDGTAALDLDVTDAGERGYRPTLWVEVYDAQGTLRAKARQSRGLLFPGTSLHQHFDLGKLPPGTYKAVVFADTGEDSVSASQYTIRF